MHDYIVKKAMTISDIYCLDYRIAQFEDRSYPIYYGEDVIDNLGDLLRLQDQDGKIMIISHPNIKNLFGSKIELSLDDAGYPVDWATFPPGEQYKNLETLSALYDLCAKKGTDKSSTIVALGGGVVQDIANYLSATYMRGIDLCQIPTTVLSQADIGFGGCAIDHPSGKSLIGQFYQPKVVVMDNEIISTLPDDEIINGLSEIINKVMCLGNLRIDDIDEDFQKIKAGNLELLHEYIKLSNQVKLEIIEKDEIGTKGTRFFLDWGHTITYALENSLNYSVSHGWALGIGMYGATVLSNQLGYLEEDRVERLKNTLEFAGLPTQLPKGIDKCKLSELMSLDQKAHRGQKRFILLRDFGSPFLSDVIDSRYIFSCLEELK